MNISEATIKQLQDNFTVHFYDNNCNEKSPKDATELYIGYEKINGKIQDSAGMFHNGIYKSIKAPLKKEVTFEWVLSKIASDNTFVNFCSTFNKILNDKGLNAYPASYGIGIFVAIGRRASIEDTKTKIETELNNLGIKYTTEYSEGGWVFRYRISRAQNNINLINSIK